jgi:hypothetical protein
MWLSRGKVESQKNMAMKIKIKTRFSSHNFSQSEIFDIGLLTNQIFGSWEGNVATRHVFFFDRAFVTKKSGLS